MKYKAAFKDLSFSARCAAVEIKAERLETHPDKDRDAFITMQSSKRQKLVRLKYKFAQFRKEKLANKNSNGIFSLMENKMTEIAIAQLLLNVGWDYQKVKEIAKANGFAEPSDTEIFWGGFIAGGVSYYQRRQEMLKELYLQPQQNTIDI
jgi:hypothetical protein